MKTETATQLKAGDNILLCDGVQTPARARFISSNGETAKVEMFISRRIAEVPMRCIRIR